MEVTSWSGSGVQRRRRRQRKPRSRTPSVDPNSTAGKNVLENFLRTNSAE